MTSNPALKKLSVVLFLVHFLVACSHEEYDKKMIAIAKDCKEQIVKMKLSPFSKFDAYYDPSTSSWNWFGTDEERFKYRKCLIEHGVELGEQKKE